MDSDLNVFNKRDRSPAEVPDPGGRILDHPVQVALGIGKEPQALSGVDSNEGVFALAPGCLGQTDPLTICHLPGAPRHITVQPLVFEMRVDAGCASEGVEVLGV